MCPGFALTFKFPLGKIIHYIDYGFERVERSSPFVRIVQAFLMILEADGDDQKRYAWKRHFLLCLSALGFSRESFTHGIVLWIWIMELPEPLESRFGKVETVITQKLETLLFAPERSQDLAEFAKQLTNMVQMLPF